jgi:FAD/FMN-containing dehydrogenase
LHLQTPETLDVSTVVLVARRLFQCPFAVKSGGHAAFVGASSVEGGITVDLVDMKERKLSADQKTAAIGAGNRRFDVYDYLTPYNLAVVGDRVSTANSYHYHYPVL